MKRTLALMFIAALAAYSQQPRVENGRVETRTVAGDLGSTLHSFIASQSSPAWIGYAVPIIPGDRQMCGWEGQHSSHHLSLEGPSTLFVLFRVEQKEVVKIRTTTPDCDIDAGGLAVTWLTQVRADQSVRFLKSLVGQDRLSDPAIMAIAFHQDASAGRVLEELLAASQPDKVREKAVMWLCVARHDYDPVVRVAHADASAHVRGQALFWLAQGAQKKLAADTIAGAIANDPETEVKKKAVFALTQMPDGAGVPKLIEVARTNRNTEVRKQALFWLGQSKDPRALDFIEQVLTR